MMGSHCIISLVGRSVDFSECIFLVLCIFSIIRRLTLWDTDDRHWKYWKLKSEKLSVCRKQNPKLFVELLCFSCEWLICLFCSIFRWITEVKSKLQGSPWLQTYVKRGKCSNSCEYFLAWICFLSLCMFIILWSYSIIASCIEMFDLYIFMDICQ